MKKIICLLAILSIFSMSGCSDGGTKLTNDNVDDYLNISVSFDKDVATTNEFGNHESYYSGATAYITVSGASNTHDYNGCEVEIEIFGTLSGYDALHKDWTNDTTADFSKTVNIDLDIGGNGSGYISFDFPKKGISPGNFAYPTNVFATYSIVGVKGSVSK